MTRSWKNAAIQENTNCVTKYVVFKLVGDLSNPNEITSRLRIKPSFSHAKGTPIFFYRGEPKGKRRQGIWGLSSQGQLLTSSLERHLTFLIDKIEPTYSEIIDLRDLCNMIAYFDCYLELTSPIYEIVLTPLILRRIANLNAYLSFAIEELDE